MCLNSVNGSDTYLFATWGTMRPNGNSYCQPSAHQKPWSPDEKGFFNHQKLTNMAKATNGSSFISFHGTNHVKKEPRLNIERCNSYKKRGNPLTKGNLNICPARDIICKNCKWHTTENCKMSIPKIVNTASRKIPGTRTKKLVEWLTPWAKAVKATTPITQ